MKKMFNKKGFNKEEETSEEGYEEDDDDDENSCIVDSELNLSESDLQISSQDINNLISTHDWNSFNSNQHDQQHQANGTTFQHPQPLATSTSTSTNDSFPRKIDYELKRRIRELLSASASSTTTTTNDDGTENEGDFILQLLSPSVESPIISHNQLNITKKDFLEKYNRKYQMINFEASTSRSAINNNNDNNDNVQAKTPYEIKECIKKLALEKFDLVHRKNLLISGAGGGAGSKRQSTVAGEMQKIENSLKEMEEELTSYYKKLYTHDAEKILSENRKAHKTKSNEGEKNKVQDENPPINAAAATAAAFKQTDVGKRIMRASQGMKFLSVCDVFKPTSFKKGLVNRQKVQVQFKNVATIDDLLQSHAELSNFIKLCECISILFIIIHSHVSENK